MLRRKQHPEWSEAQVKNVLYWQKSVDKRVKDYIVKNHPYFDEVFGCGSGFWNNPSMEGAGIYVLGTLMKNGFKLGVDFETKPITRVIKVALLMYKDIIPRERQKSIGLRKKLFDFLI